MHIPDGLIAPQAWLAAAALAVPVWCYASRRVARGLDEQRIPRMAVLTALALVLSTIMLPLPGGTSVHLIGNGLLVLAFGFWPAFLAFSLVLFLQSTLMGAGGITALPVNALAIGLVGGAVVLFGNRLLTGSAVGRRWPAMAVIVPVWAGVVAAALLIALVLGLQPSLGADAAGQPLYFPFGPDVTVPVIVGPHLLLGLIEGVLCWAILGMGGVPAPAPEPRA